MTNSVDSPGYEVENSIIRETFIDPIRTMVVIDDEFPTLEALVNSKLTSSPDTKLEEGYESVKKFINFARSQERPWLVEVHDGGVSTNPSEAKIIDYLQHSDLVVLDYHLEGDQNGGDSAIGVLRTLATSNHFNLVIVYTKGYDNDHIKVFNEICVALTHKAEKPYMSDSDRDKVQAILDSWDDEAQGVQESLLAEIPSSFFAVARSEFGTNLGNVLGSEEGKRIKEILNANPTGKQLSAKLVIDWLFMKKEAELQAQLSDMSVGKLRIGRDGPINWITSDRIFITVVPKSVDPASLVTKLQQAIKAFFPSPHRLLFTKMRSDIDDRGRIAESTILLDRKIQTVLVNELLKSDPSDEHSLVSSLVDRHWEALGDQLRSDMKKFVGQLRRYYGASDVSTVMEKCGLDLNELNAPDTLVSYNSFVSTKPFDRSHLTTGHVFQSEHNGVKQTWVCLTPACDMVPGQKKSRLPGARPFTAVLLHVVPKNEAVEQATENIFLFIKEDSKFLTYSTHREGQIRQQPLHQEMFALNDGRFVDDVDDNDNKIKLATIASTNNRSKSETSDSGEQAHELMIQYFDGEIIAQLRSEYALNLLQRLGAQVSRAGLGMAFRSKPKS